MKSKKYNHGHNLQAETLSECSEPPKTVKLRDRVIDPDMIGAHSPRSGGVMALKIMGYNDSTIRKSGRWTSGTW